MYNCSICRKIDAFDVEGFGMHKKDWRYHQKENARSVEYSLYISSCPRKAKLPPLSDYDHCPVNKKKLQETEFNVTIMYSSILWLFDLS